MTNINRRLRELEGLVKARNPGLPSHDRFVEWSDAQLFRRLKEMAPELVEGIDRVEDLSDGILAGLLVAIRHGNEAIL